MKTLLACSIILLPFNGLPLYFLGLIGRQGAFYTLLPLLFFFGLTLFFNKSKLRCPYEFRFLAVALLIWVFLSFLYNINEILISSYLNKDGLIRFCEQYLQLSFGLMVSLTIANIIRNEKHIYIILNVIKFGMTLVLFYGVLQFFAYKFGGILLDLQLIIGSIILPDGVVDFAFSRGGGVHSFSQEPSMLAGYLAFISPFIICSELSKKKYLFIIFITALVVFTMARTAYMIYFVQLIIIMACHKYRYFSIRKLLKLFPYITFLSAIILMTPLVNVILSLFTLDQIGSNATRYSGLYAAIQVFLNNNLALGVGLGQFGFFASDYMPLWGLVTHETQAVFNSEKWPYSHNLFATLLAEIGIVGFLIFASFFAVFFQSVNNSLKISNLDIDLHYFGIASCTSLVGIFLSLLSREPISNLNIWFCLGFAMVFLSISRRSQEV